MYLGLVSATFRQLTADDVIKLVKQAGLDGIEWSGDLHCPPGFTDLAKGIKEKTEEAGLKVLSYGSYYKVGTEMDFAPVLETAKALSSPNIRVWAYNKEAPNEAEYEKVIADTKNIRDLAKAENITISYEYHPKSLTYSAASALKLLNDVTGTFTYWQENVKISKNANREEIAEIKPFIKNVHLLSSFGEQRENLDFKEWFTYLEGLDFECALLEFVKHNDPREFLIDAETLIRIKKELEAK